MEYFTVNSNFDFPFDLIFHILSLLPVNSLLRFKSVCKTWYALIQNPNFIKTHHAKSNQNLGAISTYKVNSAGDIFSIWLQSREEDYCLISNPKFLFKRLPYIVGIYDGLVCAILDSYDIIICNPSINGLHKIPPFNLRKINEDMVFMGFISQDNDYKLFRIIYGVSRKELLIGGEVYTMSSDTWNTIEVKSGSDTRMNIKLHSQLNCDQMVPVVINEVFYWQQCVEYNIFCVTYFDTNSYVFGVIELPIDSTRVFWQLVNLKGELALVIPSTSNERFELWVFTEKERSWTMKVRTKKRGLNLFFRNIRCLGCENKGKLVMRGHDHRLWYDEKMFLYDLETHEITHLSFPELKNHCQYYLYTESLLWPYDDKKREDK